MSFPWRETLARLLISSAAAGVRVGGLDLAKNLDPLYSRISRVLDPDAVRGPNLADQFSTLTGDQGAGVKEDRR